MKIEKKIHFYVKIYVVIKNLQGQFLPIFFSIFSYTHCFIIHRSFTFLFYFFFIKKEAPLKDMGQFLCALYKIMWWKFNVEGIIKKITQIISLITFWTVLWTSPCCWSVGAFLLYCFYNFFIFSLIFSHWMLSIFCRTIN